MLLVVWGHPISSCSSPIIHRDIIDAVCPQEAACAQPSFVVGVHDCVVLQVHGTGGFGQHELHFGRYQRNQAATNIQP